ncbi:MAG: DEAD/DEAH box helicase family protein [Eubacterium sp.]|nr:DEAD/DEAH box helicase family protein [Eubacterium sp.]
MSGDERMNYKDMDIKRSYISCGEDGIADALIVPALKCTNHYCRSVGYFSSGVFDTIMDGIPTFVRNGGDIKMIASPKLNDEDIEAINLGYEEKERIIGNAFSRGFLEEVENFDDSRLALLAELIARGVLDIKIAVTNTLGDYHDKLGILEDFDGNKVVFYGSANSSKNGYRDNYDKIRVVKSWIDGQKDSVDDEVEEFDSLWDGTNKFVDVYEYKESARKHLLQVMERRSNSHKQGNTGIKLRDYQEEAIKAWVNNDYHGFYVMATGTGKTWTAIYSAKRLLEEHSATIVICAPYKHLVKQWAEDVRKTFPDAVLIMVSSENPSWDQKISQAIINKRYNKNVQIIIISTIVSFNMDRFSNVISKDSSDKLLIVDEAHRFTKRSEELKIDYKYMLGLSATPYSGRSAASGKELMKYFGGQVFNLPIETALERKFLVPYYYKPIFVYATGDEEDRFRKQSRIIASYFRNGKCIDSEGLAKALRNRLRIISMAQAKIDGIGDFVNRIEEKDHVVVYCGDGRLYDDTGEEIRHIRQVKRVLNDLDFKASQFTAQENMTERMELVDAFNKGEISALAAIRCLDEGINIPSIKSALILSSNDDYREFVQRRGRILRLYDNKESAVIYDIVVLPSNDLTEWAKIELRRYREYAKLSINCDETMDELDDLLVQYGLSEEDVDVYDYEEMEDEIDE